MLTFYPQVNSGSIFVDKVEEGPPLKSYMYQKPISAVLKLPEYEPKCHMIVY